MPSRPAWAIPRVRAWRMQHAAQPRGGPSAGAADRRGLPRARDRLRFRPSPASGAAAATRLCCWISGAERVPAFNCVLSRRRLDRPRRPTPRGPGSRSAGAASSSSRIRCITALSRPRHTFGRSARGPRGAGCRPTRSARQHPHRALIRLRVGNAALDGRHETTTRTPPAPPGATSTAASRARPCAPARSYLDEDLAALSPGPVGWEENPDRTPLDLAALFGASRVWLEIGFGGGEHMVHQAALQPRCRAHRLRALHQRRRDAAGQDPQGRGREPAVHPGDVRDLFDVAARRLRSTKAFLLYPDPWPKTRHHRRRFVTPEHLEPLPAC